MSFVNKSPVHWTDIMTLQTSQRLTPWLRKEWILHSEINSTHQSINKTVEQNWRLHLYKLGCGGSESGSDGHAVIDEALKQRFNQSYEAPCTNRRPLNARTNTPPHSLNWTEHILILNTRKFVPVYRSPMKDFDIPRSVSYKY